MLLCKLSDVVEVVVSLVKHCWFPDQSWKGAPVQSVMRLQEHVSDLVSGLPSFLFLCMIVPLSMDDRPHP